MSATPLFCFRFDGPLGRLEVGQLAVATDMRITPADPDMVGSGFFGASDARVAITLTRLNSTVFQVDCFTHQPDAYDRRAVAQKRNLLLHLLPRISDQWAEFPVGDMVSTESVARA